MENEPPSPFISLHLTPFRDKISFILFPSLSLSFSLCQRAAFFHSFEYRHHHCRHRRRRRRCCCVMRKKREYERRKKVYDPTITVNKLCLCVPGIHLERERKKERKKKDTKNKAKEVRKELSCS